MGLSIGSAAAKVRWRETQAYSIHSGNSCPLLEVVPDKLGNRVSLFGHCLGGYLTDVEADNIVHALWCLADHIETNLKSG